MPPRTACNEVVEATPSPNQSQRSTFPARNPSTFATFLLPLSLRSLHHLIISPFGDVVLSCIFHGLLCGCYCLTTITSQNGSYTAASVRLATETSGPRQNVCNFPAFSEDRDSSASHTRQYISFCIKRACCFRCLLLACNG